MTQEFAQIMILEGRFSLNLLLCLDLVRATPKVKNVVFTFTQREGVGGRIHTDCCCLLLDTDQTNCGESMLEGVLQNPNLDFNWSRAGLKLY